MDATLGCGRAATVTDEEAIYQADLLQLKAPRGAVCVEEARGGLFCLEIKPLTLFDKNKQTNPYIFPQQSSKMDLLLCVQFRLGSQG